MIEYRLPRDGRATVEIYDSLGQRVAVLVDGFRPAGAHVVGWEALRSTPFNEVPEPGR